MKKLLIVVDYQYDFVKGALGFEKAVTLQNPIIEKIEFYKKNKYDIIYTFDTHDDDYLNTVEGKNLPIKHCIKNTNGHMLFDKVQKYFDIKKDVYFNKCTFGSLELANYLKDKDYSDVLIVGLVSNICVLSNAVLVKSALPNASIAVDAQCTASFDDSMNEKAFDILEGIHIKVLNR